MTNRTDPPPEVTVGAARLSLNDCQLSGQWKEGKRFTRKLELPGKCLFVRDRRGDVQVVQTESGPTLLVVSSRPLEEEVPGCDTRVLAVVVQGANIAVSTEVQRIRFCGAQGPFDTVAFLTLARSAKRIE